MEPITCANISVVIAATRCTVKDSDMPRYFFHIRAHDDHLIADEEGVEHPNEAAAVREATMSALDLHSDAIRTGRHADKGIEIAEDAGQEERTVSVVTIIR